MSIELKRVDNDINGNPRYVVHFLHLVNDKDEEQAKETAKRTNNPFSVSVLYNIALNKARAIRGKKYRGKDFGGGIVFQSYNKAKLIEEIKAVQKQ